MDAGPENRSFSGFVFSGPFPGGVCVCARVLKDPARRGMILPRPRVHRTGLDDMHFKLRDDGAHQPPQTPKPRRHMRLSRISGFPRIPQNNRTQRGSESHVPVWVSGGVGLQVKVHGAPSWHQSWGVSLKELVSRWPVTPGPYLPMAGKATR